MKNITIGMNEEARNTSAASLEQYLADSFVLYAKTLGFHWNVQSSDFGQLHAFFEEQYTDLAGSLDETAERIKMMGAFAPASLAVYLEKAQLKEENGQLSDQDMLKALLTDHETLCQFLREQIPAVQKGGDEGTADYYIARLQVHEKFAWMLRSHIVTS